MAEEEREFSRVSGEDTTATPAGGKKKWPNNIWQIVFGKILYACPYSSPSYSDVLGMLVQKDLRFLALTVSNVVLRELAVGNFKEKA